METPPIGICSVCKRQVSLYYDPREDLYHTFMHRAPDGELCDGSRQLPIAYVSIIGEGEGIMETTPIGICQVCKQRVSLHYLHPDDVYEVYPHLAPCKTKVCRGSHQLPAAYVETAGQDISLHSSKGPKRPIITTLI